MDTYIPYLSIIVSISWDLLLCCYSFPSVLPANFSQGGSIKEYLNPYPCVCVCVCVCYKMSKYFPLLHFMNTMLKNNK